VHEWLVTYGGSERVLKELIALFPEADLFAVVDFLSDEDRVHLLGKRATTTFVQRLPFARRKYRAYLPLMPVAIEQLDLSGYDLVISSSHAVAKGGLTGPRQTHICYCHTPIRYAWDLQHQYLREAGLMHGMKSIFARGMLHYIRQWDLRSVSGVDCFVANSAYVAARIRKLYGRDAVVIPPPVDIEAFGLSEAKEDFYLTASRVVPYKRMELIAKAFAGMPDRRLVVIGDGPEMKRLRAAAADNITILGHQPFSVLRDYMQRARAFVFAAEEDFGIIPVEAQACGTPVIAFGRGGALETVSSGANGAPPTGIFFPEQTEEAIIAAVQAFEETSIDPRDCRRQAEQFSVARFREAMTALLERTLGRPDAPVMPVPVALAAE
jgi:glycosyltransferase involved in cell wall biosynthesis